MADVLESNKALDVLTIDIRKKASFADFLVVASGTSHRHVGALADHAWKSAVDLGHKPSHTEGQPLCDWVIVDLDDVVVHLFHPDARALYELDKLWMMTEKKPSTKEGLSTT